MLENHNLECKQSNMRIAYGKDQSWAVVRQPLPPDHLMKLWAAQQFDSHRTRPAQHAADASPVKNKAHSRAIHLDQPSLLFALTHSLAFYYACHSLTLLLVTHAKPKHLFPKLFPILIRLTLYIL